MTTAQEKYTSNIEPVMFFAQCTNYTLQLQTTTTQKLVQNHTNFKKRLSFKVFKAIRIIVINEFHNTKDKVE